MKFYYFPIKQVIFSARQTKNEQETLFGTAEVHPEDLPVEMEVDWVRVYRPKK